MSRKRSTRADFVHFEAHTTRWQDNDVYGHMNNVVYYEYVDSAVNRWLIQSGALEVPFGPVVGLVVETACTFHAPLGFPEPLETGLAVERIGNTSVTYKIGLFVEGQNEAAAEARFTHVYVDAGTRRPIALPVVLRSALAIISRS